MFSQDSEPVVLKRDLKAIVVPAGMEMDLRKGALVYITQAMGGSFTGIGAATPMLEVATFTY